MPKTITLSNTKVREILLSKDKENIVIQVVYLFIDDKGEEYGMPKRATLKDFSKQDSNKLETIFNLFSIKIKEIENL